MYASIVSINGRSFEAFFNGAILYYIRVSIHTRTHPPNPFKKPFHRITVLERPPKGLKQMDFKLVTLYRDNNTKMLCSVHKKGRIVTKRVMEKNK